MGPIGMTGDLRLLPGRQLAVDIGQRLRGAGLEARDIVVDGDGVALGAEGAQLLDLALEVGDRLFELEVDTHPDPKRPARAISPAKRGGNWPQGRGMSRREACRPLSGQWYRPAHELIR